MSVSKYTAANSQETIKYVSEPILRCVRREEVVRAYTYTLQSMFADYAFKRRRNINGERVQDNVIFEFGTHFKRDLNRILSNKIANQGDVDRSWLIYNQIKICEKIIDSGVLQPRKAGIKANFARYIRGVRTNWQEANQQSTIGGRLLGYIKTGILGILEGVARVLIIPRNLYNDYSWRRSNFANCEIQPNDISTNGENISPAHLIAEYLVKAGNAKNIYTGLTELRRKAVAFRPKNQPIAKTYIAPKVATAAVTTENMTTEKKPIVLSGKEFTSTGIDGEATNFANSVSTGKNIQK